MENFCGFLKYKGKEMFFCWENYRLKIFDDGEIRAVFEEISMPQILHGRTEDNYSIIFVTEGLGLISLNYILLNSPIFIIGKNNVSPHEILYFDKIDFVGKSVNLVYNSGLIFRQPENSFECKQYNKGVRIKVKSQVVILTITVKNLHFS